MTSHLSLERLHPEHVATAAEQAHLDGCARCRVEARLLLASMSTKIAALEGIEEARETLAAALATTKEHLSAVSQSPMLEEDGELRQLLPLADLARRDRARLQRHIADQPDSPFLATPRRIQEGADGEELVVQYVAGNTMGQWLVGADPLHPDSAGRRPDEIRQVILTAAIGLTRLHETGLYHGDLGEKTIVVTARGDGVLVGAGRLAGDEESDAEALRLLVERTLGDEMQGDPYYIVLALAEAGATGGGLAYRIDELLGRGGMGEVRRVYDHRLRRSVALKTLISGPDASTRDRFLAEARITAQLQHPGVLPVHDLGVLPDGRPFFTMKEATGRSLRELLQAGKLPLRRALNLLQRVCDVVAYAHSRGVIHRDLKPDNVLVGEYGEVWVVDWGLAKALDTVPVEGGTPVSTGRADQTRSGQVAGTPIYMAPEQARGEVDALGPATDVYAIGAMLYQLLAGHPPYSGNTREVLVAVITGPPPELSEPAPLVAIQRRAMAREQVDRPTAGEVSLELASWFDDTTRREKAAEVATSGEALLSRAQALSDEAAATRERAKATLADVPEHAPSGQKQAGWILEDRARDQVRAAHIAELDALRQLHHALELYPSLPQAHAVLGRHHLAQHKAAEEQGREEDALSAAHAARRHLGALPPAHRLVREGTAWLLGDGWLTLHTDPPNITAVLYGLVESGRRQIPKLLRALGPTPIIEERLPHGSYIVELRGQTTVRYPVVVPRQGRAKTTVPGGYRPHPVSIPASEDEIYVPAGWATLGGVEGLNAFSRREVWVGAFHIQRLQVTNTDYLAFLDDLVARGRTDEALRYVPRERPSALREEGAMIYGFDGEHFALEADADGDVWDPLWPVLQVDWYGAVAYAAWWAERTGRAWRLPTEYEWEKAAAGVDGRAFPWGDRFDPSFARMGLSHADVGGLPGPVGSVPTDVSPYGMLDVAGNAGDWTSDAYIADGPPLEQGRPVPQAPGKDAPRVNRGGNWVGPLRNCRVNSRYWDPPSNRSSYVSFRLARDA